MKRIKVLQNMHNLPAVEAEAGITSGTVSCEVYEGASEHASPVRTGSCEAGITYK